jgi:hypothetical protein
LAAVGVAVLLGLMFLLGVLLSSKPRPVAVTTPSTAATARHASPAETARRRAHAAAVKVAAKLPVSLESAALLRVGKTLYVVGGETRRGGKPTDKVFRITLAKRRVQIAGRFLEPLANAGADVRGGVLYLAGGWTGEKVATAVLRWSPGQTAAVVTRLPVGLRSATAAFVGGRLFVAGGSPRKVFAVDVHSGKVSRVSKVPRQLSKRSSNLDLLAKALR